MIKSYWLRILICGIATAIVGFIIAAVTPQQYDAVLQVLVAPYSPIMPNNSTEAESTVQDLLNASAPRSVTTQVEMLTSYGVVSTAGRKVAQDMNVSADGMDDELNTFNLMDQISITAAKESDLVTVRVRLRDKEMARRVAEQMYLAFEDQNLAQSRENAEKAIKFLKSQNDTIQKQVETLANAEAAAKTKLNTADLQSLLQAKTGQLQQYEAEYDKAQASVEGAQAKISGLEQQKMGLPEKLETGIGEQEDPRYSALSQQLLAAQAERESLLERYLEDSEFVKAVDRRIKGIQARLKTTKRYSRSGSNTAPNPELMQIDQELRLTKATLPAAQAQAAAAQTQMNRVKAELAELPNVQKQLDAYTRERAVLERISALYTTKLRTLEYAAMGRRTTSQLVTPAQAIPRPAVPNYPLNVGLGLFLGLAVGFLWSIGTEAKRNPIRSLGQLNRLSLQPCYRVVPELRVPMRGLNRAPAEVFDSLLVNFVRSEKKGYRLGILGVTRGAGASTSAMNLAIAAARGGYSVLYVEVDPGNNALTKLTPSAGDVKSPGANISIYNASLGETQSGSTVGLPSDLERAAEGKDLIIFDFPPVKASGDAFLIANQLDEMVLLVRANVTKSVDFLQAQQALIDAGCPLVSVTLSRVQDQSDDVSALEQQAEIRSIAPPQE